jgi:pilus assembly protein Flp/PilA
MARFIKFVVVTVQLGLNGLIQKDRDEERGATAVEYGLMVALIAIVIIAAVTLLGGNLSGLFGKVANSVHS